MDSISPSAAYYTIGAAIAIGSVLTKWLSGRDKEQELRFNERLVVITLAHNKLEEVINLRLAAMKLEAKEASAILSGIERSYITRVEHAEFKAELMAAVRDVGAQVTHSLDGFRTSIEKLIDRVSAVEARR